MKHLIAALLLAAAPTALAAQTPAAPRNMATSADPAATKAAMEIYRQGGNATDAALAMMLALTVVEPQSSGIGGGGFLVHHDGRTGVLSTIDGREKAPAGATPDRFLGPDGKPLGFRVAQVGGRSIGVPGNIRLAALAHGKWGKLSWSAIFQPAIRLAEDGFTVNARLASAASGNAPLWDGMEDIRDLYAPNGKLVAAGNVLKNPKLAKLLRRIAADGPDAFYKGDNAEDIVRAVRDARGSPKDMTLADLAAYEAKERPPVCGKYRVYTVCGMGPPSAGATTVLGILGQVERFDLKRLGAKSPTSWHVIGEAMRLTYADRDKYSADRDFVPVPVAGLIDPGYLKARSRTISTTRTLDRYEAGNPPGAAQRAQLTSGDDTGTTHFIAADRDGGLVTMTSTVEAGFGSQVVVNGLVLNNELTDFSLAPERDGAPVANRVEGNKRPLSSMAPTIVYDAAGKPIFLVGAAGGRTIPMQVTKALIAHLDWGMSAGESVALGQIYYDRDGALVLEQGTTTADFAPALEKLGQKVKVAPLGLKANAAEWTPQGWVGAADPRSPGDWASE